MHGTKRNGLEEEEGGKSAMEWCTRTARSYCSQKAWLRRFPVINFVRDYSWSKLLADTVAGISVALILIPQSMAIAALAGLPLEYGLYSSILPCFVYGVFGSVKEITIGPTLVGGILLRPFVDKFGYSIAILLAFCSGIFLVIFAMLNLVFIMDFMSLPVLLGFMSAAGLSIISGQVGPLIGFQTTGQNLLQYWQDTANRWGEEAKLWDGVLGACCIVFLLTLEAIAYFARIPEDREVSKRERIIRTIIKYISLARYTLVILISAGIVAALTTEDGPPVEISGEIEKGFPEFKPPPFEVALDNVTLSFGEALSELAIAVIIPISMMLEIITATQTFAMGVAMDIKQEILVVGFTNIAASFIQAFSVTSSLTRAAINKSSGVQTPLGTIVTGAIVLLFLGLFSTIVQYIPNAALAAVIMCAIYFIVKIPIYTVAFWRSKKLDLVPMYLAFLCCCFLNLSVGIVLSVIVNIGMLLYHIAKPQLIIEELTVNNREVLLITPDRSISFPAAQRVRAAILKKAATSNPGVVIVVSGAHFRHTDVTGVVRFKMLVNDVKNLGHHIAYWHWPRNITEPMIKIDGRDPGCFYYQDSLPLLVDALPEIPEDSANL